MTKKCFRCEKRKPLTQFYAHPRMRDGLLNKCKACTKKDVRANYRKTIEKRREYERKRFQRPERKAQVASYGRLRARRFPGKARANQAVNNAIRDGRLVRRPCEVCGDPKSQAHHDDYRKPLDVRWLCFKHHREVHGQVVAA